jgi:hypothetical protein
MFHEIDVAQLEIVIATAKEEEEEDPSSTCGGCGRRKRGESGVVSNSRYNNDDNNLGIPIVAIARKARAGVVTRTKARATRVDGSGSHEFKLQWLTSQ